MAVDKLYKMSQIKKLKVLYAEDERETLGILSMLLRDYVENVFVASNGEEALELFENNEVDLILTDILMPKLTGIQLVKQIRAMESEEKSQVPIIIATAFSETEYLLDSIRFKCDGYILKPIDVEELLDAMYSAILPRLQAKEIISRDLLLDILNIFMGDKKIEIIRYIFENSYGDKIFKGSHEEIADKFNVARQTVAKIIQQMVDLGLLVKLKNKTYQLKSKINIDDISKEKKDEEL